MSGEDSSDIPDPASDAAPDAGSQQSSDGRSPDPNDPMGPPAEPCECWCMHCRRTFMSGEIWFQRIINDPGGFNGTWMCPTPNCDGAGFTFDIWPTDPEHPINKECVFCDDSDDEEFEEDEYLADDCSGGDGLADVGAIETDAEWDPDESKWKELDELFGGEEDDDDLEGEEWKYGLQPGERPSGFDGADGAQFEDFDEDERRYDEPDRRPREVDWSDREDRRGRKGPPPEYGGEWSEDDIPF
jgi:hypothetical protein